MSYEFSENDPSALSPEVEIATTELFVQASFLLDTAPVASQLLASGKNVRFGLAFQHAVDEKYPHNEVIVTSKEKAAFYNATKEKTAAITRYEMTVDGDAKQLMRVVFYQGAPFAHFYDDSQGGFQFDAPANRAEDSAIQQRNEATEQLKLNPAVAATPLRTISAWFDTESGSISDIESAAESSRLPDELDEYETEKYSDGVGVYSDMPELSTEVYVDEVADTKKLQEADVKSMELWLTGALPLPAA